MPSILETIKNFLFPEETIEVVLPKETVPFAELALWVDMHTSHHVKSITENAKPILEKIDDALFACEANMTKLEHAELRNKNISSRELELMKGNRVSFVKRTQQFLTTISSLYNKENKEAMAYADMKLFYEKATTEIGTYHEVTLKPYAVLQHFFSNESYAVAKQVKEIDSLLKELSALLEKQSVEFITAVKEEIALVAAKLKQQQELLEEKKQLEEEFQRLVSSEEQASLKIKRIKDSPGYQKYCALIKEAEEYEQKFKQHENQLQQSFSVIEKALRKYCKQDISKEEVLVSYMEKPVEALLADTQLQIVSVLAEVKKALIEGTLEIKDDKKEKTALELDHLTLAFFQNFVEEYQKLAEQKKHADQLCAADTAGQNDKEAAYMFTTYKEKADAVQKQIMGLEMQIEKLDVPEHIAKLTQEVQNCTKRELEIVF